MASRSATSKPGLSRPGLTRTQLMRTAKSAALVKKDDKPEASSRRSMPCPGRPKLSTLGPPPADPKKISFTKPGMTKAMQMRQKLAAEKMQAYELQQKKKAEEAKRPRRLGAPVGGDARFGRRSVSPRKTPEEEVKALEGAIERGRSVAERTGAIPKRPSPKPPGVPRASRVAKPLASGTMIADDTRELAKLMNAEVVQAVPISDGPVDKIIIDPGAVRSDRSTIVCITSPEAGIPSDSVVAGSSAANRSIQVINETLDEQDAVESAAVQSKLEDLQNARREFVVAVANVGANAVNLPDDTGDSLLNIESLAPIEFMPEPPQPLTITRVPDIEHEYFQLKYGPDHPYLTEGRAFLERSQYEQDQRDSQRRMEAAFARYAHQPTDSLDLEAPLEQDIQQGDVSWEEDEYGEVMPVTSRIKASMPAIPRRPEGCSAPCSGKVEDVERFFDLTHHPPVAGPPGPPTGREMLPRDLWELEDPWFFEPPQPDVPPLMRFDSF